MSQKYKEYELEFNKETDGAFIFIIPETKNNVMLPKSQCSIFLQSDDEPLVKGMIYTVQVNSWIAEKKKLDEGGEKQPTVSIECKLLEERDSAVYIQYKQYKLWFSKSIVLNKVFPVQGQEFQLIMEEWLLNKKIEEYLTPKTGRKVIQKDNNVDNKSHEDDIPY